MILIHFGSVTVANDTIFCNNSQEMLNNTMIEVCMGNGQLGGYLVFPEGIDPSVLGTLLCSANWTEINEEISKAVRYKEIIHEV